MLAVLWCLVGPGVNSLSTQANRVRGVWTYLLHLLQPLHWPQLSVSWSMLNLWPVLSKAAPACQPYANTGSHPGDPLKFCTAVPSLGISSANVTTLANVLCTPVSNWSARKRNKTLTFKSRKIAVVCLLACFVVWFCFCHLGVGLLLFWRTESAVCADSHSVMISNLPLLSVAINIPRFLPLVSLISSWCRFLTFSTLSNISCLAPITTDLSIANKQQHQGHIFWFLSDHCFPGWNKSPINMLLLIGSDSLIN